MTTENKRHLGNIGVFDVRNASEESIRSIGSVLNVGLFITSSETASLVSHIQTKNVGATITVPSVAKLKFINDNLNVGVNYFRDRQEAESVIVNGRVLIKHGVSAEDLASGLESLYVNGDMFYPSALESIVQSKLSWQNGHAVAYEKDDIIEEGRLVLDASYLDSLSDHSNILLIGNLALPDVLPNELLERKIRSLKVTGSVRFHEENRPVLQSRIHQISRLSKMSIIPAGFQYYGMPLDLNDASLQPLESASLFVDGRVTIEQGTDSALLDSSIAAIRTSDILLCPEELRTLVAQKCDLLQTRAVFYRGELWLVEDEMELVPSRFEFMDGNATLVVTGDFHVSPDVEPKTLADRLEAVHNFGDIYCSQNQMGAIQARMRTSDGDFHDYPKQGTDIVIDANYGYLTL